MSIRKIKRKLLTFILRKKGILASDENVMLYLTTKSVQKLRCQVGFGTYCGQNVVVGSRQTKIGKFCSIASNIIIGPGEHPLNYLSSSPFFYMEDLGFRKGVSEVFIKPCEIGNDVWIGSNVFIRSGIKIGDGAVIGAGAVVTKDVPPYAVVVGVPAKILKYRFDEKMIEELLELKWWELDNKIIKTLPFKDIKLCIQKLKELRSSMPSENVSKPVYQKKSWNVFRKLREKIKYGFFSNFRPLIINRTAYLGHSAFERINVGKIELVNCAKNRVDYALSIHQDKSKRADAYDILSCMVKGYRSYKEWYWATFGEVAMMVTSDYRLFKEWYWAEERDVFKYKRVKAVVMDSFSELVDQLFVEKEGKHSFCSTYHVVKGTQICDLYDCLGLLDVNLIKSYYLQFFKELRRVYQNVPIIFIHFSTLFETRDKFIERAAQIERAIVEINQEENLDVVFIKPRIVEHHETDPNAYHYSKSTYDDVAAQLVEALNNKGVFVKLKETQE